MALDKDSFIKRQPPKVKEVPIPEWNDCAYIRVLDGREREMLEDYIDKRGTNGAFDIRARMLCMSLSDESGKRLFTDEDVDAINAQDHRVINRLFDAAFAYNEMGAAQIKAMESD